MAYFDFDNCSTLVSQAYFVISTIFWLIVKDTTCKQFVGFLLLLNWSQLLDSKSPKTGQWLWLSWYSGRFRHQRSVVRIQSLEFFLLILNICLLCIAKTKIKKKEAGDGLFLKNKVLNEYYNPDSLFTKSKIKISILSK